MPGVDEDLRQRMEQQLNEERDYHMQRMKNSLRYVSKYLKDQAEPFGEIVYFYKDYPVFRIHAPKWEHSEEDIQKLAHFSGICGMVSGLDCFTIFAPMSNENYSDRDFAALISSTKIGFVLEGCSWSVDHGKQKINWETTVDNRLLEYISKTSGMINSYILPIMSSSRPAPYGSVAIKAVDKLAIKYEYELHLINENLLDIGSSRMSLLTAMDAQTQALDNHQNMIRILDEVFKEINETKTVPEPNPS